MQRRLALAAVAVLAAVLGGCGGRFGFGRGAQACFDGDAPSVGRPGVDETYGLLRRELARSRREPSKLAGAQIFESLPPLIPDASDLASEPTCAPELVDQIDDVLEDKPVELSRQLVARIRAAGRVGDTTDVMSRKAAFLMAVVRLTDRELTDYRLAPDERGPAPAKSFVRYLALGYLSRSSMFANVEAVAPFLLDRLRTIRDDRELLLLVWHLEGAGSVIRDWVAGAPARLAGVADPIALEVLLVQLHRIGLSAGAHDDAARALLRGIVDARGAVPVAAGIPGADRDLVRVAAGALHDLDVPIKGRPREPTPLRSRFDPWRDWLDREPAGGIVPAEASARRLADLDRELARMTRSASRCAVLGQLAAAVPPAVADRRFDELVAPVFDGARLRLSREALCRIDAALMLDGVAIDRRVRFVIRLLSKPEIQPYDSSADDHEFSVPPDAGHVATTVAHHLARRPEWIDPSAELRALLTAAAMQPLGVGANEDEALEVLQPALDRVLATADRTSGIAIATAWIATIRDTVTRKDVHYVHAHDAAMARMYTLAEHAPSLGLAAEADALFAEIAASPMPSPGHVYMHPAVVRAAQIARLALASSP